MLYAFMHSLARAPPPRRLSSLRARAHPRAYPATGGVILVGVVGARHSHTVAR